MIDHLVILRQHLHSQPELSGNEKVTSRHILTFLEKYSPDEIIKEIGGHGIAAIYNGKESGSRILIRCELDALPIPETIHLPYESKSQGVAHKCGHDGHMAIVAGLAMRFHESRPPKGSVILLFQPSEETGEGAEQVLEDPKYARINPDFVYALHNLPGFDFGQVTLSDGLFASASSGISIKLTGKTSHAAEPHKGKSPALAIAQLIEGISSLTQFHTALHDSAQATIIHARIGEVAFGTSPGDACLMATLRSHSEFTMNTLIERSNQLTQKIADCYDLAVEFSLVQPFPPTINNSQATAIIRQSADELNMKTENIHVPFSWSEDFGHFTSRHKGALFGIGAGKNQPALHNPEYDFPDNLIEKGISIFEKIIQLQLD